MEEFLSRENLDLHREYLRQQMLRYSVFEVCYPKIKDKSISELMHMRIGDDKEKIISMKADIILHNVYFNSFGNRNECSKLLVQQYKSIQSFLYELYKASLEHDGFCVIYSDGERIKFSFGEALIYKIGKIQPLLAIDLSEHAYFLDYGFNKEEYLKNAVSFLNLKKIDEKMQGKH